MELAQTPTATMSPLVVAVVLVAALIHAGWNAVLKAGLDPFRLMALIAMAGAAATAPLLLWTGPPPPAAWPYVIASHLLHLGYMLTLTEAYRTGDFGRVYPIARGSAPLLTAVVGAFVFPEKIGAWGVAGVILLGVGISLLSLKGHASLSVLSRRSVGFALASAVFIAAYTVVDGAGGRVAGKTLPYSLTLFLLDGISMGVLAALRVGRAGFVSMRPYLWRGIAAGFFANLGYGIVIWAMSVAPVAPVAALRETSVLFAVLIAAVWLREPLPPVRIIATGLILMGVLLLRFS
jgi:drug/metabolite transporter (DMT)-like permease